MMMRMTTKLSLRVLLLAAGFCAQPALALVNGSNNSVAPAGSYDGLNPSVLNLAMRAYDFAKAHGQVHKDVLTVVDFTKPSYEKRLWVINLDTHQVLFNGLVAQGKNSGLVYATKFSNAMGSDESSLGTFVTQNEYQGDHPDSLRLVGLEKGINDNAEARDVVVHPAPYVSDAYAAANHRVGRSWGCFALDPHYAATVVNEIKGGSVIFAYAPQENMDPNLVA